MGQPYQFEQRIKRANGNWRWHLTHCMPIKNSEGTILKWYCTATDIHEIKKAQEDLRDADGEKTNSSAPCHTNCAIRSRPFVTGIELVKSYLDMDVPGETRDSGNDAIIRESVSIIDQQAKTMTRLLDDMLDISRISRGKVQLIKTAASLRDNLAHAVEVVTPLIKSQRHSFSLTLPDASLRVWADPVRLQQIFVNLLNNAIKYTPPGGHIWFEAIPLNDYVQVTVRDTGLGIEPENIKSIFLSYGNSRNITPFVSTQGELGIGLKLTKDLVSMHGGTITASSAGKNMGCEFTVRLRLLPDGEKNRIRFGAKRRKYDLCQTADCARWWWMTNANAADLCAKTLRFFGHETQVCYNAPEALDAVKSCRPNIMFVDIEMPGMNGYRLAEKLRKMEEGQTPPIKLVALTGYGQKRRQRTGTRRGLRSSSGKTGHHANPATSDPRPDRNLIIYP